MSTTGIIKTSLLYLYAPCFHSLLKVSLVWVNCTLKDSSDSTTTPLLEPKLLSRVVLTAVVVEDNLNLLAGAGAGFGWVNQTAVLQFQPALEVQYFLFSLEYLSFESGVGLDISLGAGEKTRTSGKLLGGFHYWF